MSNHSGAHAHHIIQPATYIKVLLTLMFFMVLTIVAAKAPFLAFGIMTNLIIALAIAFCKVFFIMSYFMHVKFSSGLVKVFAVIAFIFMIIFFTLTFNDYLGRDNWHSPYVKSPFGTDKTGHVGAVAQPEAAPEAH